MQKNYTESTTRDPAIVGITEAFSLSLPQHIITCLANVSKPKALVASEFHHTISS
jgi:hypothetical protein